MDCRLKIRFFQALLVVFMVLLVASLAQAGSSHHQHHENIDVVSPFAKINKGNSLHCILNMHTHFQNIPCPHQDQSKGSKYQEFRADCGTHSGSANSSSNSITKDLSKMASYFSAAPLLLASQISLLTDARYHYLPGSIDHPPQRT
jgi:hypothetical protein